LTNHALKPGRGGIFRSYAHMLEALAIRRATPLLRLRTAADIESRLQMLNGGPDAVPGLIAVVVRDYDGSIDQNGRVDVLINASPSTQTYAAPSLAGQHLRIHPIHLLSLDPVVKRSSFDHKTGTFTIPGRTAGVFVSREGFRRNGAALKSGAGAASGGPPETLAGCIASPAHPKLCATGRRTGPGHLARHGVYHALLEPTINRR